MSREELILSAFEAFDNGSYDTALKTFIAAHELSNDKEKKVIVDQLFSCFVLPNIDEFKEHNAKYICENPMDVAELILK